MNRIMLPMLLLGLSLSPVLCWAAETSADKAKAIAEIERLGGKVTVNDRSPDKPVIGVDLSYTTVTDAAMEYLMDLTDLQSLNLYHTKVTGAGLTHLKGLTKLQSLDLGETKVTDAGLEHLKGLTELRSLNFQSVNFAYYSEVGDSGLEQLKGLTQLQTLNLRSQRCDRCWAGVPQRVCANSNR